MMMLMGMMMVVVVVVLMVPMVMVTVLMVMLLLTMMGENTQWVPGTVLSTFHILTHFVSSGGRHEILAGWMSRG